MTTKTEKQLRFLSAIAEQRVDDLLAMTDEEILKEAEESGDVEKTVSQLRANAATLVAQSRKGKLAAARTRFEAEVRDIRSSASVRSIAEKRAAIARAISTRDDLPEQLTLAAREGKGLSDADAESMYDDCVRLGFITEEEPPA
jgi:hypothetical protein